MSSTLLKFISDVASAQAEIGQGLGLPDREDGVDGFKFEQDELLDDDVGLVGAFEAEVLVDDWRETSRLKFSSAWWSSQQTHWL